MPEAGHARLLLIALCLVLPPAAPARAEGAARPAYGSPLGNWWTEDHTGVIQFRACRQDALCGYIEANAPLPKDGDLSHPAPYCHRRLLDHLRLGQDGRWHGTVTDPENDRTYDAIVWVPADGVLRLHGYIGLPILGRTEHWTPFKGRILPGCHYTGG